LDSEINITNSMQGRKIIYKKSFLENNYHGSHHNNNLECEKVRKKILGDMTINSNFGNPYNKNDITPVKVKLIK